MPEMLTIVIDNEQSDDWMKKLPSYKDEVKIHEELAKKLKAPAKKGGPGSGHFDHPGRPGEVGGSKPTGRAPEKPLKGPAKPKAPPSPEEESGGDRVLIAVQGASGKVIWSNTKPDEAAKIERLLSSFNVDLDDLEHMFALPGMETEIGIVRAGPNQTEVSIWWTDPESGNDVGRADRVLLRDEDGLYCSNTILEFNEGFMDRRFGTSLYERQIHRLRKLGYGRITLTADIDVGRYTWAKMGFDYDTRYEPMHKILGRTGAGFEYWAKEHSVPVPSEGWPEFTNAQDVATYEHSGGYMLNRTEIQGPNIKGGNYHLGKAFMMDKGKGGHGSWSAVLEL